MSEGIDIPGGVVHDLPDDLKEAIVRDPAALATWQDITPLARNEWICWVNVRQEAGDPRQAHRLGPRELGRGQAPAVLLARLQASVTAR